jgi:2-polyprenyl-3-methyl-5-hydroxy-6-metoxy-1,4-benzoquinol methylase
MAEPQNIYDDAAFFAGYSTLERFGSGWNRAAEHADFLALLPHLEGRRCLDLGCGAGQLSLYLATNGAREITGVDLSERMLALARATAADPRITYQRATLEDVDFPPASFDLVVSSLAFHYVEDYGHLVHRIARWLAASGVLVFSTEHPIFTARLPDAGWLVEAAGRREHWAINNYADEGVREEHWFIHGVRKVHRTFATLINEVIDAGLVVERVVEPVPTEAWLRDHSDATDERRRPMFLLMRASKAK